MLRIMGRGGSATEHETPTISYSVVGVSSGEKVAGVTYGSDLHLSLPISPLSSLWEADNEICKRRSLYHGSLQYRNCKLGTKHADHNHGDSVMATTSQIRNFKVGI